MSITDHDSIGCQKQAMNLARKNGIHYVFGIELNITFSHPNFNNDKPVSLDLLGYQFDVDNRPLQKKLQQISEHREERTAKILNKLNIEFEKEGQKKLTKKDLLMIQNSADGVLGRPHIADYIIKKRIVKDRQEAFNKYLVKCDVPKFPLLLNEASNLIREADGKVILAHPNDPYGTSLVKLTKSLHEQTALIENSLLPYIDGIECWHSRNDSITTEHYVTFSKKHGLIMTGGSDCHQKPIKMGSVQVPNYVFNQFIN